MIKGAPSVSGSHNASSAEVKLAEPKISRDSSLKVIMGRYKATLKNGLQCGLCREIFYLVNPSISRGNGIGCIVRYHYIFDIYIVMYIYMLIYRNLCICMYIYEMNTI